MKDDAIDFFAVADALQSARNRTDLIAECQRIQHIESLIDRDRLSGIVKRRLDELKTNELSH